MHTGDLNQWRTPITGASREIQVVKDPCPKAFCWYCNYSTCEQDSWFLSSWTGIILFFKFSKKQKSWRQLWGRELRQRELESTLIRIAASQAWAYRLGHFFFCEKALWEDEYGRNLFVANSEQVALICERESSTWFQFLAGHGSLTVSTERFQSLKHSIGKRNLFPFIYFLIYKTVWRIYVTKYFD